MAGAGGASTWCVLVLYGVSGTIHGTWCMERACSIATPPSRVHGCLHVGQAGRPWCDTCWIAHW